MAAKEQNIKNVVLVGQGGVGKTMLAEAMLHLTGKTTRLGGHAHQRDRRALLPRLRG